MTFQFIHWINEQAITITGFLADIVELPDPRPIDFRGTTGSIKAILDQCRMWLFTPSINGQCLSDRHDRAALARIENMPALLSIALLMVRAFVILLAAPRYDIITFSA